MYFERLPALAGLIILPMILALYLFKNKRKNVIIPSVFLWNKAQQNQSAERSLQRLRKNLLMLLQLAAALFCVLAMAQPCINRKANVNTYRIVIDNSISMSAYEGEKTRLEEAKADAVRLVKSSGADSFFSVHSLNEVQTPLLSSSRDKELVIDTISGIEQSYLPVDYDAMPEAADNESLVVFSDTGIEAENISSYTYGTPFDNCGIISLSASADGDKIRVLGKVKNFGSENVEKQINIYADGKLYAGRNIVLSPDETKDVVFTQLESGAAEITAQLQPSDRFACDDSRFAVISNTSEKRVLITGESPFLERALGVMPDVRLYKNQSELAENLSGYELYIFCGRVPQNLPSDGHIIIIDPDANNLFDVGDEVAISSVVSKNTTGFKLTRNVAFDVYKSKKIGLPPWAEEIVSSPETPLIFEGSTGKQKIAVIGFDLSNSDLPLKMDFPIFIYDILHNFFPNGAVEGGGIDVNALTELNASPLAESVNITEPSGDTVRVAPPFPVQPFKADEPGIYHLEQMIDSTPVYEPFAVNIVPSDEQYFNYETEGGIFDAIRSQVSLNYDLQWIFLLLAAAVLAAEFVIFVLRNKRRFSKKEAVLRVLVIALLISSVFDPKIKLPAKGVTTVFAIDASDSMTDSISDELKFVNEALKLKPKEDLSAAVIFGKRSEILSSAEDVSEYTLNSVPDGSATNIAAGAQTAASLFKSGKGKRLVLLTDGSENEGDIFSNINALKNDGTEVKVVGFENDLPAEVQIAELKVPEYIISSDCKAEITVKSTVRENAVLKLYASGNKLFDEQVEINEGENRFTVECELSGMGSVEFTAAVEPSHDKYYQNNTAYANSYIQSPPAVLVLDHEGSGAGMQALLESGGVVADRLDIGAAPKTTDGLNKYEAVIMTDCPYYEMAEDFVSALESYVHNSAGGLFVTAGENSFAPGGYKDTILEDILPVSMDMSDKDKKKNTAMLMAVDRSGSMSSGNYGVSKLELVKEAMVRSVEVLDAEDSVGVLAFDDAFEWIVEPAVIGDKADGIRDKIYKINLGGGTSILPALEEAVDKLSQYDADSKHIILMTDGQAESSGYDAVLSKAAANNISVSTVAVGEDSDIELLKSIAQSAGGRYYYTDEFTDLPKIFERETSLSNKTYINNEEFYPEVNSDSQILDGVENMPMLGGYVASEQKNAAQTILSHNNDEPILAVWQYGLGHTGIFAADIQNQCANFLAADEGRTIIKNGVSSVIRSRSYGNVQTELVHRVGKTYLSVRTENEAVVGINATVEGENYSAEPVFEQVDVGVFEAPVDLSPGNYVLNLNMTTGSEPVFSSVAVSVPYSDEYDIDNIKSGSDMLNKLYTLAQKTVSPSDVFSPYSDKVFDKLAIRLYLIIAAIVLFYAELLLRRFRPTVKSTKKKSPKPDLTDKKADNDVNAAKKTQTTQNDMAVQETKKPSTSSILLKSKQNREK